jgi:magnesium-transporting ATPase (P-type)
VATAAPPDRTGAPAWHALEVDAVLAELDVDPARGLDGDEVERRRAEHGPNRLTEASATAWWVTLLGQFRSPLIYLLLLAGLLTLALGEHIDAMVIAAVLALNASIGFVQERKAEASVLALMQLVSPTAHVVRDGTDAEVDSVDLVPGDVVLLESGVKVPADARLVSVSSLQIDESLLTGESVPVEKGTEAVGEHEVLGDQRGVVFSGSTVTSGRARAVVVATGERTELGQIAEEVREGEDLESPLQERMRRFAHIVGAIIAVSAALTFALGMALDHDADEMLLVAAALAVAAIPEGLPVVLTVALALGVRRMAQRNAIVRRLSAVETLGSTTVIGSDKTGTLTENRMTVRALWVDGEHHGFEELPEHPREAEPVDVPGPDADPYLLATLAGVLANEGSIEVTEDAVDGTGDPTEVAFLVAAARHGLDVRACRSRWTQTAEIPFESEHRYAASFRRLDGQHHVFVKGAPERVLEMCEGIDRDEVLAVAEEMAAQGLRVLATAGAPLEDAPDAAAPAEPTGLRLLGLHGLLDPPRPGVPEAIAGCQRAGQRVVMITGDHAVTARAIARQVGIVDDDDAPVLTGVELDDLDDEALSERVDEVSVFARVSPEHKLRIVRAVRARATWWPSPATASTTPRR